jgi:aryl-alcohol dehydrogenase-like predicted oxidoreductase
MELARLGRSGLRVSRLGVGTMTFGTQMDESAAHLLLDEAYESGINYFDTAEIYPVPAAPETHGAAETILGRWLKRIPRDGVVIGTKLVGAGLRAARKYGLDPIMMSYAWVRQQTTVATVLSSFSRVEQLRPVLQSAQIELDTSLLTELDAVRQQHDARWNMLG